MTRHECALTLGVAAIVLSAFLAIPQAFAQPTAVGGQFQINSYTTSTQGIARVAVGRDGTFIVAWQSFGSPGDDDESSSILAQRYAADGSPAGTEFQVNSHTTGAQENVDLAVETDGGFVVVWQSGSSPGDDDSIQSIQARRYDAGGSPLGDQFQVNTSTFLGQRDAAVATAPAGGFVVVWDSYASLGSDDGRSIQAQRFDCDGASVGTEFQVNTYTTGDQRDPALAFGDGGELTIVWAKAKVLGASGEDSLSVRGQRYDDAGAPVGTEFQANTYTSGVQSRPAVAATTVGGFVLVWQSTGSFGDDQFSFSIQARRYDASGSALGAEFQVNTYTSGFEAGAKVAVAGDGGFLVTWDSRGSDGVDTEDESIQARSFGADGAPHDAQFEVNEVTREAQLTPSVSIGAMGKAVIVWTSDTGGTSGDDLDGSSVQGQRFQLPFASTTTTTLAPPDGECADPVTGGPLRGAVVTATDALFVLQTAVGLAVCEPCVCDVDDNGSFTATDALIVLNFVVGLDVTLNCPAC